MTLTKLVQHYFTNFAEVSFPKTTLVRPDGIVVYAAEDAKNEAASIGALVGGVWQAATALGSQQNNKDSFFDYRFSFDKSDSGIYILLLVLKNQEYYLCTIYDNTFNPALLKRNFRVLKEELNKYINENIDNDVTVNKIEEENRADYLFKNITDEEMDNLFAFY